MSSNLNATKSNSSKIATKKNTKNEKVYRRFDTILKKTPEIYDNYLVLVNDFIKSKLTNVKNNNFYDPSKEGFNSNNETLSVSNQKKVYLNTYVIPLLYLINSYEYQKYYKNTMAIEANQLIMANIDYYKNYFFNYKLPIIKSVNVDIYKYNYGNASSNNNMNIDFSKSKKKKKIKIESKGIVAKVDKDIKINITKLISYLEESNILFKQLMIPYLLLDKIKNLNAKFTENEKSWEDEIMIEEQRLKNAMTGAGNYNLMSKNNLIDEIKKRFKKNTTINFTRITNKYLRSLLTINNLEAKKKANEEEFQRKRINEEEAESEKKRINAEEKSMENNEKSKNINLRHIISNSTKINELKDSKSIYDIIEKLIIEIQEIDEEIKKKR